jgi:hypothetical protein
LQRALEAENNYGAKTTVTRLSVLNTNVGGQSASQRRLAIVPDFVAVPRIAKVAEGKYQVGELGAYAVEGEQVFESPEKPFTTTDLVPAGALNSDVAMVPQNA